MLTKEELLESVHKELLQMLAEQPEADLMTVGKWAKDKLNHLKKCEKIPEYWQISITLNRYDEWILMIEDEL